MSTTATQQSEVLQEVQRLRDRVDALEAENEELHERVDELEAENERLRARFDARTEHSLDAIGEVQSRELEKGAHLDDDNIIPEKLDVEDGCIERFPGDDGTKYVRLPESSDPLERSGESALATGDLLPIQQLARLDDDMLSNNVDTLPARLAAKVWTEMSNDRGPWSDGCKDVDKYMDSSELRIWIRTEQEGISKDYARKLAQRTMDSIEDLAKNRLYSESRTQKKNGLKYKERRLILPSDSDIPGHS